MSDVAANVADIIRSGPVPTIIKPIWAFIRFAAFGTLPEPLRAIYGVKWSPARERLLQVSLAGPEAGPAAPAPTPTSDRPGPLARRLRRLLEVLRTVYSGAARWRSKNVSTRAQASSAASRS